jgi:beta-galactosidase/beta-glucuronidase
MLHFERCDYVFDGWVNGHYLGKHVGGYDAFRYDISDFLVDGENLIVVRAYDDKDPSHVRGKQTWKEKPFDGFFPTTSGLYGDVWLEEVARASFQGYDARGSFDEKSVYFRLLFTPEAIGSQAILNVSYRGKAVCSTSFEVNNIYMEQELAIPAKDFHRWTPAYPCLYDLEMVLVRNGEVSDKVLSYFGINSISQRKNAITLNGQKRYLKFVLYQGYNPKGGLTFDGERLWRRHRLN